MGKLTIKFIFHYLFILFLFRKMNYCKILNIKERNYGLKKNNRVSSKMGWEA